MLIKKFVGKDIEEIQEHVIEEFGPFAVILFTRIISKGFFKTLFFGEEYEVVVGVEAEDYDRHLNDTSLLLQKNKQKLSTLAVKMTEEARTNILVSGSVQLVSQQKNKVFLVGLDDVKKTLIATKFALKWQKEAKLSSRLMFLGKFDAHIKKQMESLAHVFGIAHQFLEDEKTLSALIFRDDHDISLIVISGKWSQMSFLNEFKEKTVMLVLNTVLSIGEQFSEIEKYHSFGLFGLIYTKYEEKPSFLFLEELFEKQNIPISYLLEGSEVKLADANDLETRLINEKLTHLPSW